MRTPSPLHKQMPTSWQGGGPIFFFFSSSTIGSDSSCRMGVDMESKSTCRARPTLEVRANISVAKATFKAFVVVGISSNTTSSTSGTGYKHCLNGCSTGFWATVSSNNAFPFVAAHSRNARWSAARRLPASSSMRRCSAFADATNSCKCRLSERRMTNDTAENAARRRDIGSGPAPLASSA
eukprot:9483523-Pyramimonas_sp.AAC.2